MTATPDNPTAEYQPGSMLALPALYAWPPRLLAALQSSQEDVCKQRRQPT
jgi:hypothetical protein